MLVNLYLCVKVKSLATLCTHAEDIFLRGEWNYLGEGFEVVPCVLGDTSPFVCVVLKLNSRGMVKTTVLRQERSVYLRYESERFPE